MKFGYVEAVSIAYYKFERKKHLTKRQLNGEH